VGSGSGSGAGLVGDPRPSPPAGGSGPVPTAMPVDRAGDGGLPRCGPAWRCWFLRRRAVRRRAKKATVMASRPTRSTRRRSNMGRCRVRSFEDDARGPNLSLSTISWAAWVCQVTTGIGASVHPACTFCWLVVSSPRPQRTTTSGPTAHGSDARDDRQLAAPAQSLRPPGILERRLEPQPSHCAGLGWSGIRRRAVVSWSRCAAALCPGGGTLSTVHRSFAWMTPSVRRWVSCAA